MIKGLDNWITECRIENPGIDPQIIVEASHGTLFVRLGNFNTRQARGLASLIAATCDAAEGVLPLAGSLTGDRAELLEAAISARMALAAASDRDKAFLQDYHRLDAAINAVKGGAA